MPGADWIWGPTERNLAQALDAASLRQRAIAHNLANVETPGFRRFEVVFEELLAAQRPEASGGRLALRTTHPRHLPSPTRAPVQPTVVRDTSTYFRNDLNNVDPERELVAMAKNALWYQALLRTMASRVAALRTVIHEGRR